MGVRLLDMVMLLPWLGLRCEYRVGFGGLRVLAIARRGRWERHAAGVRVEVCGDFATSLVGLAVGKDTFNVLHYDFLNIVLLNCQRSCAYKG